MQVMAIPITEDRTAKLTEMAVRFNLDSSPPIAG